MKDIGDSDRTERIEKGGDNARTKRWLMEETMLEQ
jgi:hypothetical protein